MKILRKSLALLLLALTLCSLFSGCHGSRETNEFAIP